MPPVDHDAAPALWFAARAGDKVALESAINTVADVDCATEKGVTALMLAAATAQVECVTLLLKAGAESHLTTAKGRTALHIAEERRAAWAEGRKLSHLEQPPDKDAEKSDAQMLSHFDEVVALLEDHAIEKALAEIAAAPEPSSEPTVQPTLELIMNFLAVYLETADLETVTIKGIKQTLSTELGAEEGRSYGHWWLKESIDKFSMARLLLPPPEPLGPPARIRVVSGERGIDCSGTYNLIPGQLRNGGPCYTREGGTGAIYYDGTYWKICSIGNGAVETGWNFSQSGVCTAVPLGSWDASKRQMSETTRDYSSLTLEASPDAGAPPPALAQGMLCRMTSVPEMELGSGIVAGDTVRILSIGGQNGPLGILIGGDMVRIQREMPGKGTTTARCTAGLLIPLEASDQSPLNVGDLVMLSGGATGGPLKPGDVGKIWHAHPTFGYLIEFPVGTRAHLNGNHHWYKRGDLKKGGGINFSASKPAAGGLLGGGGASDFAVGSKVNYGSFRGCTVAMLHADGSVDVNVPGVGTHSRVARSTVRLLEGTPPPLPFGAPAAGLGAPVNPFAPGASSAAPPPAPFGAVPSPIGGRAAPAAAPNPFGAPAPTPFGAAPTAFGQAPTPFAAAPKNAFGVPAAPAAGPFGAGLGGAAGAGLFGGAAPAPAGGLFGGAAPAPAGGLFGGAAPAPAGGLFGGAAPAPAGGLFGGAAPAPAGGLFGGAAPTSGTVNDGGPHCAARRQPQEGPHVCMFCKGRFTSCFGSYGVRNRITRTWREGTSADPSDYPESPNPQYCTQGCEISARPAGGALFGGGARPSFGSPSSATTSPFAPAPSASSLFGSPPPAGAFGAASPAPATSGFGFGAASPAPATSGFGFGAASPAPATSGFGFGAAPAFSQTPNPAFSQPMAAPAGGILGMPAAVPAPAGGMFGSTDALFRVEGAGAYDVVNGDYKVDVAAGLKDGAPCYIKIASREFGYGQVFHTIARRDGKWWMIESVPSQPPRMLYSVAASADDKPPPTGWGRDSCVPFGNGCFAPSAEKMALMPSIVALRAAAATLGAPAAAVPSADAELEQQLEQLHTAVKENKLADVKALLADVKAGRCESSNLVNMADEKGITALVWAAAIGHGEMVRFLLEAGADKTAVTKKGNNALQAAKLGQAKTGGNARFDEVIRALESPAAFGSFGAPAAGAPSAFGAPAGGGLGATPSAFGSPAGGAFGVVAKPAFGAPTPPAFGAPTPPAFGAATPPAFGAPTPPAFGAPTPPAFGAPSSSGAVPSLFAHKPAFSTPGGATPFGAAPAAAPAAGFSFGGTATATALAPAPSPATVSPLAPASEASSVFGPAPAPPPPLLVGSPEEAYSFGSIGVSPPSPSVGEWVLVPSPADEL
jgi:hypothetical protein